MKARDGADRANSLFVPISLYTLSFLRSTNGSFSGAEQAAIASGRVEVTYVYMRIQKPQKWCLIETL